MNYIDVAVLAIVAFEMLNAFRRGMVKAVVEMAGWIVALITAKLYYKALSEYLVLKYDVFKHLEGNIYKTLTEHLTSGAQVQTAVQTGNLGGTVQLPAVLKAIPKDFLGNGTESVNQMVYGDLAHKLAELVTHGASFMLISFAVILVIILVSHVAQMVVSLPLLREANKLGGLAVGFVKGCFNVFVIMTAITFALPLMKQTWLIEGILHSQYGVYFYNNNVLLYFIYYLLR